MEHVFNSLLADGAPDEKPVGIQPLYGGNPKAVQDMNPDDFRAASDAVLAKVREQAFSRGLPIVYEIAGRTVREYADGRLEPVR
ncbi:hypothetical protein [Spirosoma rhododendri]|uniref:Uncharacterized protein n=1 Tax=Spirosoma rhododendri TaxID=2728024 RepID=A0A7L5DVP2_9BACT|nr:hypothetical protein [Spirosoma rhododendri]QJD81541.1 hypothetical protein HH216_24530 [Spirosoma rhododendri]